MAGLFLLLLLVLAAMVANLVAGGPLSTPAADEASSIAVFGLAALAAGLSALWGPGERRPALLIALGLGSYAVGYAIWTVWFAQQASVPVPSVADGFWLAFYPLTLAALVLWARRDIRPGLAPILDTLIVVCTVAALGVAVVLGPVSEIDSSASLRDFAELAYPASDIVLAAFVLGVLNLRGWRPDRRWWLLGGGFLLLSVGDCIFALGIIHGASDMGQADNLLYLVGATLLAIALWQAPATLATRRERPAVLVPTVFSTLAVGLLLLDHVHSLNSLAWLFALLAVCGALLRMVLTFRDVRGLAEARREAITDELTQLPNRRAFTQHLDRDLATARLGEQTLALLLLDLDNFKQLNDTLGHLAGDSLLVAIGPRIRAVLRAGDTLARVGGDEFAILLAPGASCEAGDRVAMKVRRALEHPFTVSGLALRVTASVGIAVYPYDAADAGELFRHADVALHEAKSGRSGQIRYRADHDTHSLERLTMAQQLVEGIGRDELEVYFQPQVGPSRRIEGAEALVRWSRPDGELLSPQAFLPTAERAGLSRDITRVVLGRALDEVLAWRAEGHGLTVSVNTTVADLVDDRFPEEVAAALADRGLAPGTLTLEVTETSILSDPLRIGAVLGRLRGLGIGLSLDDFGTGFSSLDHLRTLPVHEIKIDRSFVRRMLADPTDAVIVQAMALLGQQLELRIVAEGAEDSETWARLVELGCQLVQGYELSPPVPAGCFRSLLKHAAAHGGVWDTVQG